MLHFSLVHFRQPSKYHTLKSRLCGFIFCLFYPAFLSIPKANKRFFDNFFANCHYLPGRDVPNPRANSVRISETPTHKKPKTKKERNDHYGRKRNSIFWT